MSVKWRTVHIKGSEWRYYVTSGDSVRLFHPPRKQCVKEVDFYTLLGLSAVEWCDYKDQLHLGGIAKENKKASTPAHVKQYIATFLKGE